MSVKRKIQMVVTQVKMDDEDNLDVNFWMSRTAAERLAEVFRLRQNYFTWADGSFPDKMEKIVHRRQIICSNPTL
ncbi:hypothetical protein FO440_00415 [Mucilaginibacter corticis]|uniref:Uncharacterized protein n=1 Tax=Mucilaginibacter corticis TaxID=2597670 RepID=A0A556MRX4_9SPHI|nr:hypothetical protein FO440_00415 [Mucilaginibacter corticis]